MILSGQGVQLEITRQGQMIVTVEATGVSYQIPLTGVMPLDLSEDEIAGANELPQEDAIFPWTKTILAVRATSEGNTAADAGTVGSVITVGPIIFSVVTDGTADPGEDEINAGTDAASYMSNIARKVSARESDTLCTAYIIGGLLDFATTEEGSAANSVALSTNDPNLTLAPFSGGSDGSTVPKVTLSDRLARIGMHYAFKYVDAAAPTSAGSLFYLKPAIARVVRATATDAGTPDAFIQIQQTSIVPDSGPLPSAISGIVDDDIDAGTDAIEYMAAFVAWLADYTTDLLIDDITDNEDGTADITFLAGFGDTEAPAEKVNSITFFSSDSNITFTETTAGVDEVLKQTTIAALVEAATGNYSANVDAILAAANYAAIRALLDLEVGTDIQAKITPGSHIDDPAADLNEVRDAVIAILAQLEAQGLTATS